MPNARNVDHLVIRLFGEMQITDGDGNPIPFDSVRAQSLLAYLVLRAGQPQSRRHLAFLLWPDSSDEQARSNLRKLVHDLRRALPEVEHYVGAAGPSLVWRAETAYTLDVAEFQRRARPEATVREWREAVEWYRGPLFQSCYDDWILPERERLHQRFVEVLGRLMEVLESQGDYRGAIEYGQRLVQHDPLHEDVYRSLMRLYAVTEDRAAAVRMYQACAAVLREELDVAPSPATQQAYERLLEAGSGPGGTGTTVAVAATPWVGHRAEWRKLQAAWGRAAKGQPHWVVLTGAAGIGKTRLAEELLGWAAKQGLATASARCYAAEAGLGYGPITTWLKSRPLPPLDKVWRAEIARLLPDLLVEEPSLPAPGPLTEPWQRLRFFEALGRALLGRQPLLLLLDDLPFCDRDTLEWLHYVVRSNPRAALLIVTTLCLEDMAADSPVQALLGTLRRAGQLTEIGVAGLTPEETGELAAQLQGEALTAEAQARLYAETEGNPLFVVEMVRAGPVEAEGSAAGNWPLPRTMQAVIAGRLQQLTAGSRALVHVAAVIGRAFTVEVLGAASGWTDEALAGGLAELRQKRIVKVPQGTTYEFDHAQLAAVAYGELNPAERRHWHRRVAEALLALHGAAVEGVASQVVEHYEAAGLMAEAAPYVEAAGDAARRRYANATAIGYYRRGLEQVRGQVRGRVQLKLGAVLELVGEWCEAEGLYREALAGAQGEGDRQAEAEAQLEWGELLHRQGWDGQAEPLLRAAQAGFAALGAHKQVGHALESLGLIYEWRGAYREAGACHAEALALAEGAGDRRGVCRAVGNQGLVAWRQGEGAAALAAFEQQYALAHDLRDPVVMSRALGRIGLVYLEQGKFEEALAKFVRRREVSSEVGDRLGESYAIGQIGAAYYGKGDYARALAQYVDQLRIAQELGTPRGISQGIRHIGLVYYQQGEYAQAQLCFARSLQIGVSTRDWRIVSYALAHLANAYSAECHYREAERIYALWHAWSNQSANPFALSDILYHQAHLYFRQENYGKAQTLLGQASKSAEKTGRKSLQFKIQLLALIVRQKLGHMTAPIAVHELQALIGDHPDEKEQAALYYALSQLNPDHVAWRKLAAKFYRHLYAQTPKWTYRLRHRELTGRNLAAPSPLPELPAIVTEEPVELDELLKQVSAQIAEGPRGERD